MLNCEANETSIGEKPSVDVARMITIKRNMRDDNIKADSASSAMFRSRLPHGGARLFAPAVNKIV